MASDYIDPLKISLVFRQPEWTVSQRQAFMSSFSDNLTDRSLALWTGTMRRLPRGLAYRIEEQGYDEPLLRLSYAPGFEGGALTVTAFMQVPPPIKEYHRMLVEQGVEQAREKMANDWLSRYFMPALGWLLRIPDHRKDIEQLNEKVLAQARQELLEQTSDQAAQFWTSHAAEPVLSCLVQSALAALETIQTPGQVYSPLLLKANGRLVEVAMEGVTLSSQDKPASRAVLRA